MKKKTLIFLTHPITVVLFFLSFLFSNQLYSNSSHSKATPESNPTSVSATKTPSQPTDKETMIHWSRQLGVTCIHCHNLDNFKDDSKPTFKVSFKHFQMVKVLQEEVFSERDKGNSLKVKVDCYFCHRGKELPDYIEPPVQLTK